MPYRLAVRDIALFERPVRFARPFRFGAVDISATPQVFVRVEIEVEGKGTGTENQPAPAPNCWCQNGSTSGRIWRRTKRWKSCGVRC